MWLITIGMMILLWSLIGETVLLIVLICLDEYVPGEAAVHRVLKEFPTVNYISVGGNWNGYTEEAKATMLIKKYRLFNSSELTGALWKDEFWAYHQKR
ncbi:hypothetical protein OH492_16315 [Vibrio chagasii]|nr:hypothetical protein [Vibrio chagasii]